METYCFYDSTGTILRMQTYSFIADSTFVAANTPTGQTALLVPAGHPVLSDPTGWQVVNGSLVQIVLTAAQLLQQAQAAQNTLIVGAYETAITAPIAYMNTTFRGDKESQTILAHSLTAFNPVGATPAGFYFLDTANNKVAMTLTQLQGLGSAVAAQYLAAFQKRVGLQEQIAVATTIAEVQAVVW